MELKFNKNGDAWVAEFEATDKFNLHMEGLLLGSFSILQRTAGGKYTHVRDIPTYPRFDKVFDYDFNALVYPKFIKIVSETEPTYAEVVSDGEITEIKSQTKEVEVTANGTTQVAPDAGYSYLTGVTVKTNVPQSGGGAPSGGINYEYYDISNIVGGKLLFIEVATLVKVSDAITTLGMELSYSKTLMDVVNSINAIAIDKGCEMFPGENMTVGEFFAMAQSQAGTNPTPITKEEFYTI